MPDRLSALDASFLQLEDGVSHMHSGSVGIYEGPPPPQHDLVRMIAGKLPLVPRYRQVIGRIPGNLYRPVWVDDTHFNIDYHVRRTALPAPGSEAELRRLVGRVMSQQLDRSKPLWEIWIVEGLEDGHWAMLAKTHHCLVDGVAGTELLALLLDVSADFTPGEPDDWQPAPRPSSLALTAQAVTDVALGPVRRARTLRDRAAVSAQAVAGARGVARGLLSMAALLRPTEASSLNGPIGPHRRWDWASASVADIRTVRGGLGGTFNDVVLTVIAAGFRRLLQARGETAERVVRTMVPVSVRSRDLGGMAIGDRTFNNKVSAMFAELPVHVSDPATRLRMISVQMEGLKESREALAGQALTSMAGFAPPALLGVGLRLASAIPQRNLNTVTTNVPGPQFPLYMCGRRMLKAFPYVPLWGHIRITIAIFSYDGQVNFGVTGDYDTAPDLDVLCRGIEHGLVELLDASRPKAKRASTPARRTVARRATTRRA